MTFNYGGVSRFVREIGDMPYGTTIRKPRREWIDIIPRADPIRQMMLDRPEIEREPLDWIRFWLNGTSDDDFMVVKHEPYRVGEDLLRGDLIISLPAEFCPKCRGRGVYEVIPDIDMSRSVNGDVPQTSTCTVETVKCNCENRTEISERPIRAREAV